MGNNGSKFVKKIVSPFSNTIDSTSTDQPQSTVKSNSPVLVISRKGSMFFDEDGDLAHEFYIEVPPSKKGCKATMKKVLHNLIPQGEVAHQYPRLHVDFPIILHQVWVLDFNLCEVCCNVLCFLPFQYIVNIHTITAGPHSATICLIRFFFFYI